MTPAFFNATLDQSSTAFPLILFSPGFGGVNWINTFYLLEFASHGFIVIGINHPGTSAVTLLTNGSQVKFNTIEKDVFTDADLFDASLAKISSQQASNISILVDTAIELNSDENSFLYQKINTSKIFAVGHSIGGAASFIACGQDQHISKAVNFDGAFVDGINTDYTGKELLLINSDRDKFRPKNRTMRSQYDEIMHRDKLRIDQLEVKANLQRMMLPLTGHLNFADVALIIRPAFTQLIGLIGKINGLDLLRKTAAISMDFFDR